MKIHILSLFLVVLSGPYGSSLACDESKYDVFGEDTVIRTTLKTDIKSFIKNKDKDEYQNARISMIMKDELDLDLDIKIKPRGNSRRVFCNMPPVLLNFPKKEFPSDIMEFNKLKLVTYCKESKNYDQYILKEYLAYKLYNELTDYSLRVRLLEITYEDSVNETDPITALGFIIEDIDDMASRFGYEEINTEKMNPNYLQREQTTMLDLFQYMIGNTDWSATNLHNIKLMAETDSIQLNTIPIAYDFDVSGFVNPVYAKPSPELPIEDLRTRLYRGFCRNDLEFQKAFSKFKSKKQNMLDLIRNNPYLTEKTKKFSLSYLEGFFEIIENEKKVANTIMRECR